MATRRRRWPSLAPAKNSLQERPKRGALEPEDDRGSSRCHTNREDVKREPLTPPKVERATATGMIQDMTPSSFSPKVWEENQEKRSLVEWCSNSERANPSLRVFSFSHHCYGVGGQQLLGAQGGDVRHVDKDVNKGDNRDGDEDGTR